MEVRNQFSENLNASRTPNNMAMNLDVEKDYGTNATSLTTSGTASKIVEAPVSNTTLVSEENPETSLAAHGLGFSVTTKDLNMPASELQDEAASIPVYQPTVTSVELVYEAVNKSSVEQISTSMFQETIASVEVIDEAVGSSVVKNAFGMIEEPVSSPVEMLQQQSSTLLVKQSTETIIEDPAEEPIYNFDDKPVQEPLSDPVMEKSVQEQDSNIIPKEEASSRPFIHAYELYPVEKLAEEPFSNPVMEEAVKEPSYNHVTEEKTASAPFSNLVTEEQSQEHSDNRTSEEQADLKSVIPQEIRNVENELVDSQASQPEEPFDDMVVLEDGMVVITATLVADTTPTVEGGEAASSELSGSVTSLEDWKPTLEVEDVVAEPIHEVQGNVIGVEVVPQVDSPLDIPSGETKQLEISPAADIPADRAPEHESSLHEQITVDYDAENRHKECREENEPVNEEQQGKVSGDVEAPINAQLIPKHDEEAKDKLSVREDGKDFDKDAESLIDRKVLKRFGKKSYVGDIVSYDSETKWYKVVYEDGDEEDLEKVEVEPILLAPGTAAESVHKKRARSMEDDEKEDNRAAKRLKKATCRTPKKSPGSKSKKPQAGSKSQGSKGSKSIGGAGNKGKGVRFKQQIRKGKITKKQPTGSGKKSPEKKVKQTSKAAEGSDVQIAARKSPGKKSNQKTRLTDADIGLYKKSPGKAQMKRQQKGKKEKSTTPKKGSKGKKSRTPQKSSQKQKTSKAQKVEAEELKEQEKVVEEGRKIPKHGESQVEDGIKKQTAGAKRKADMEQHTISNGKRLKREVENVDSGGSGQMSHSRKGATKVKQEVVEGSAQFDQVDNGPGALLKGRIIKKKFDGVFYNGEVVRFDKKTKYYKVCYEDGDSEDLEWSELEALLTSGIKGDIDAKKTVSKKTTKPSKTLNKRSSGASAEKSKQHTRNRVATRSRKA